jgi:hypothetical protein
VTQTAYDPIVDRTLSEETLKNDLADFTAKYYAVFHLRSLATKSPEIIESKTLDLLRELMEDRKISHQRRSLFLFRQAAETLTEIITRSPNPKRARRVFSVLTSVIQSSNGHAHRASCEALGSLPFALSGPELSSYHLNKIPKISWENFLCENRLSGIVSPSFIGRSLVSNIKGSSRVLVIKFARKTDSVDSLLKEWLWLQYLGRHNGDFQKSCRLPRVLKSCQQPVFKIKDFPVSPETDLHPSKYAIGFIAHQEYFKYPNDFSCDKPVETEDLNEVMTQNAWILGKLASLGIIHCAPIPLFHNRVQRERRRDNGLYEWFRGGRLDRWLDSCTFPNFGTTGIRDLEHLESFRGSQQTLYRFLGSHFLSLFLVTGSHFRNKNPGLIGLDESGNPVDARYLFNPDILKTVLQGIFHGYYEGFVGMPFDGMLPLDWDRLVYRMIDEMGVDRHMEEILRIADQLQMNDKEFHRFLLGRGFSESQIKEFTRGDADIILHTGPHLGAFNDRISLPELIEAVETTSAFCIAGKFFKERFS